MDLALRTIEVVENAVYEERDSAESFSEQCYSPSGRGQACQMLRKVAQMF
jgi:hypothetical protein